MLDQTFVIVTQQKRRHPTGLKTNWQRWGLSVNVSQASSDVPRYGVIVGLVVSVSKCPY